MYAEIRTVSVDQGHLPEEQTMIETLYEECVFRRCRIVFKVERTCETRKRERIQHAYGLRTVCVQGDC